MSFSKLVGSKELTGMARARRRASQRCSATEYQRCSATEYQAIATTSEVTALKAELAATKRMVAEILELVKADRWQSTEHEEISLATIYPAIYDGDPSLTKALAEMSGLPLSLDTHVQSVEPTLVGEQSDASLATCIDATWCGRWAQASVETEKLDDIMRAEGAPWLLRKVVHSFNRNATIKMDDQNEAMTIKVQMPLGSMTMRVAENERRAEQSSFHLAGVKVSYATFWEAGADGMPPRVVQTVCKQRKGADDLNSRIVYELDASAGAEARIVVSNFEKHGEYKFVMTRKA